MYQLRHILREIAKNAAMGVPVARALRVKHRRTTDSDLQAQARQMRDQFAFFMDTLGSVSGKTITEIGPGDTVALGALFLKHGAQNYIAFDRYRGDVFGPYAEALYRELGCFADRSRITLRPAVEQIDPAREDPADVIVSFDVVEHLADPHVAFRKMALMLKPDGVMVHRVDYGPHDIWRSYPNGLEFLAVPDVLWSLMGSNRGYPNKVRHAELMRTLRDLGFKVAERITRRFTQQELEEMRGRLLPRYRQFTDDELLEMVTEFACSRAIEIPLGEQFPY